MNWNAVFSRKKKGLAVLLDPDKHYHDEEWLGRFSMIHEAQPDAIFIGGSRLSEDHSEKMIQLARSVTQLPIIAFPGDFSHVSPAIDGVLFLSLISGRNPEYLINQHVKYGWKLRQDRLATLPTGYILVDGGISSSVAQVSQTLPIPHTAYELAAHTAVAGEMLGMQAIYLEAGSGAFWTVPTEMVRMVREHLAVPLIVGGGIRSAISAQELYAAGADTLVVGNGFESDPAILKELCRVRNEFGMQAL